MHKPGALYTIYLALLALIILVALAACDAAGIPQSGTPETASTSTPKTVAIAEPTSTESRPAPEPTNTSVVGGSSQHQPTATSPRATFTAVEPTEEPTAEPATPIFSGDEATPTILPEDERVSLFQQVWDTVSEHYLYRDFNGLDWNAVHDKYEPIVRNAKTSTEFYKAISDMVDELNDDHSRFLSPEERQEEDDLQSGNANYVGVGIVSAPADKSVMVVFVFPGSPAGKAGIIRRDRIMAVDGRPIEDPQNIADMIRGEEGTTVNLTIRSPGQDERVVPVVRGRITGAIVPSSSRLERDPSIGYLIIPDLWTDDMGDRVENELDSLLTGSPDLKGLVVDLRGNGGGFRSVLEQILGDFVSGQVGSFFDSKASYPFKITAGPMLDRLKDVPVVILVDGGSESYAEVLAASIQEKGRAQVVGVHSAGNTETIYQYNFDDGSRLWCAQEGFKLLDGTNLEGRGVIPDFVIQDDWTNYPERDDPDIVKAIELLTHPT